MKHVLPGPGSEFSLRLSPGLLKRREPSDNRGFWVRKAAFLAIPLLQEHVLSAGTCFDSGLSYLQEVKGVSLDFYRITMGLCRLSVA